MFNKKYIVSLVGAMLISATVFAAEADTTVLTLEESIQMAIRNNEQLKAADSSTQAAAWNVKKIKGAKNFSIDFSHTTAKIGGEYWRVFNIADDPSSYFTNTLSASLPLYTGGRIENSIKQAELGSEISVLQLAAIKQDVKYRVTQAYYTILACRNMQTTKAEAVEQLAKHLEVVQQQFIVGTVTKADVLRSEVALANAKQGFVTAENNTKLAMSSLNRIMGQPVQQVVTVADTLDYEPTDYQLDDCLAYALKYRPDILAAQKMVEQDKAGVKVALSAKKPDVTLTMSYGTYDTKINEFNTKQWLVGVTAHINIFDGNITNAGVESAQATVEMAKHQQQDLQSNIEFDVQQSYLNMTKSANNIETNRTAVDKAAEDFMLASVRYGVNLGTNLEVVDAQVALTTAKTAYIESLYDYNVSKAALEKAMGKKVEE
jgi:outer membrane protein